MRELCCGSGEFAAAVALVVETILFEQCVASVLQSVFSPVLCPEVDGREGGRGSPHGAEVGGGKL